MGLLGGNKREKAAKQQRAYRAGKPVPAKVAERAAQSGTMRGGRFKGAPKPRRASGKRRGR
jgi:hypothetical protein